MNTMDSEESGECETQLINEFSSSSDVECYSQALSNGGYSEASSSSADTVRGLSGHYEHDKSNAVTAIGKTSLDGHLAPPELPDRTDPDDAISLMSPKTKNVLIDESFDKVSLQSSPCLQTVRIDLSSILLHNQSEMFPVNNEKSGTEFDPKLTSLGNKTKSRGILLVKEKRTSYDELIEKCMRTLSTYVPSELLLEEAEKVFDLICFNEFFMGECEDESCPLDHYSLPDTTKWDWLSVCMATLYVIRKATRPKIGILKMLVTFICGRGPIFALGLATCIPKMKQSEQLEFAGFLVNSLAGFLGRETAVMMVLFITYPVVRTELFNILFEHLEVFEMDSTIYLDLLNFLNFRIHVLPYTLVERLIRDVLSSENNDLVGIVVDFFNRLPHFEKGKIMGTSLTRFMNKIDEFSKDEIESQTCFLRTKGSIVTQTRSPTCSDPPNKKRVSFSEHPRIVRISDGDHTVIPLDEYHQPSQPSPNNFSEIDFLPPEEAYEMVNLPLGEAHEIINSPPEEVHEIENLPPEVESQKCLIGTKGSIVTKTLSPTSSDLPNQSELFPLNNEKSETDLDPKLTSLGNKTNARGILLVKEKRTSYDELIEKCMRTLSTYVSSELLLEEAEKVFDLICFNEFFMGECEDESCPLDHYGLPDTTKWDWPSVCMATVYVIRKATRPKIGILKMLVKFISGRGPIFALGLATCIPKMKQSEQLEFAGFLVNSLAGFLGRETAVMMVLFITYPVVRTELFNILLEHLEVFEMDSTIYLDLLNFLNFRIHVLPYTLVEKLIRDVLSSENNDLAGIVIDFFNRLRHFEKGKIMGTSLTRFMNKIDEFSKDEIESRTCFLRTKGSIVTKTRSSTCSDLLNKKRVSFAEHPRIVRISDGDHTIIPLDEYHQPSQPSPNNLIEMDFLPPEEAGEIGNLPLGGAHELIDLPPEEADEIENLPPEVESQKCLVGAKGSIVTKTLSPTSSDLPNQSELFPLNNEKSETDLDPKLTSLGNETNARGILLVKEKRTSYDELIENCMRTLSTYVSSELLLEEAEKVFDLICFNEFFMGECEDESCPLDHYGLPDTTKWDWPSVCMATVYVIRKATRPKIGILKMLVKFISGRGPIFALGLATCIPKMKQSEQLEFAGFLVNSLAGFLGRETAVMMVLFITYPVVRTELFNILLERLEVFEMDSTIYLDLLNFLNFRIHVLPYTLVEKLIGDVLSSENNDLVGIVIDFFNRLRHFEKGKIMGTSLTRFMNKIDEFSKDEIESRTCFLRTKGSIVTKTRSSTCSDLLNKKRVSFAEHPRIVRISDGDHTVIPLDEYHQPSQPSPNNLIEMDFLPPEEAGEIGNLPLGGAHELIDLPPEEADEIENLPPEVESQKCLVGAKGSIVTKTLSPTSSDLPNQSELFPFNNEKSETDLDPKLTSLGNKTNARGILLVKEKRTSYDELIEKCMRTLSTYVSSELLLEEAEKVFDLICFNEFFMGECEDESCPLDHYGLPDTTKWDWPSVCMATVYVIRKAIRPKIGILKMLVKFISGRGPIFALGLATCIPKMKQSEQLEFAGFLVNSLAGFLGRETAVMMVLFITYPVVRTELFNILLERLEVFEMDSTIYLDLLNFLNFRIHVLPYTLVEKLIRDVLSSENNDLVGIVIDFFNRLRHFEKGKIMGTSLTRFMNKIDEFSKDEIESRTCFLRTKGSIVTKTRSSTCSDLLNKKRVSFAEHPRIVRISDGDHTVIPLDEYHQPSQPSPNNLIEMDFLPPEEAGEIGNLPLGGAHELIDLPPEEADEIENLPPEVESQKCLVGAKGSIVTKTLSPTSSDLPNQSELFPLNNEKSETDLDPKLTSLGNKTNARGILLVKEKRTSYDELIEKCMRTLSTYVSSELLLEEAEKVFDLICFNEFFMGECEDESCPLDHYGLPDTTKWDWPSVCMATVYVIRKATRPKIGILKMLVKFISGRGPIFALGLATCIPKMKQSEQLEFAGFLVNSLTGFLGRETAVMMVLFITYPVVRTELFNILLERLEVFEMDSTIYLDLLNFLNFRIHVLPYTLVEKLIRDVLSSENNDLVGIVIDFFNRLRHFEKGKIMVTSLTRFMNKIDEFSKDEIESRTCFLRTKGSIVTKTRSSTCSDLFNKKRVSFAEHPRIVRISDGDHTVIPLDEYHQPSQPSPNNFSEMDSLPPEEDYEIVNLPPEEAHLTVNSDSELSNDETVESVLSVVNVFKNLCPDWILNGNCEDIHVCRSAHILHEDDLASLPVEQLIVASEFLVDKSVRPSLQILEVFLNVLSKLDEHAKLLMFRKCASKLTTTDSSRLTIVVLYLLTERFTDRWDAVEMVLTPNPLDLTNKNTETFLFDRELLNSVMKYAMTTQSEVSQCVFDEILRRFSLLPEIEKGYIWETCELFVRRYLIGDGKFNCTDEDFMPLDFLKIHMFSLQFKSELDEYSKHKNNCFVVLLMLRYAFKNKTDYHEAMDILYFFLYSQSSRANILNGMLEHCLCFPDPMNRTLFDLVGSRGLCTVLRLFEEGKIAEATEMFVALRTFKLDLFALDHRYFLISDLQLALTICTLFLESEENRVAVELFLTRCLKYTMDNISSSPLDQVNALAEKMFEKFNCKLLWQDAIELFGGIQSKQKSLSYPLNILKYYESTLRITFSSPFNAKAMEGGLTLYLQIEDSGVHVDLQKNTLRSLFLCALNKTYISHRKLFVNGLQNLFCPLIKKLLACCIKVGAYSQFESTGSLITLYSSMTEEEINVYLLWWCYYFIRAKKRENLDLYCAVQLKIVEQDTLPDTSSLPVHFSLENVNNSVQHCTKRLSKLLKRRGLFKKFKTLENGSILLSHKCIERLCKEAFRRLYHHRIGGWGCSVYCLICLEDQPMCFDL